MKDKWDENLRSKLSDFEAPQVPVDLWAGIERELDKTKPKHAWWRYSAAAAAVLLAVVGGTLVVEHLRPEAKGEIAKVSTGNSSSANKTVSLPYEEETSTQSAARPLLSKVSRVVKSLVASSSDIVTNSLLAESNETSPSDEQNSLEQPQLSGSQSDNQNEKPKSTDSQSKRVGESNHVLPSRSTRKSSSSSSLSLALYASKGLSNSEIANGYDVLSLQSAPSNSPILLTRSSLGQMEMLSRANATEQPITDVHHSLPVRLGLSISYGLTNRLSLSSGLVYTQLHSTLTSGSSHSYFENRQHVDYLGFPLSLNYTLLTSHGFRLYGSAGAMVELPVKGKVDVDCVVKNVLLSTEQRKLKNLSTQYSVNAAAGLEYGISRELRLFAEPGLSYYPGNSSDDISTIYTDKPLNFNLQLGIRFSIDK